MSYFFSLCRSTCSKRHSTRAAVWSSDVWPSVCSLCSCFCCYFALPGVQTIRGVIEVLCLQLGSSVCSHAISTSGCCGQAVKNTHCLHPELSCCLLKIPSHRDRNRAISLLSPGQAQSMNLPGCHRYGCWCYYSTVMHVSPFAAHLETHHRSFAASLARTTKCANFSNRAGPRALDSHHLPGGRSNYSEPGCRRAAPWLWCAYCMSVRCEEWQVQSDCSVEGDFSELTTWDDCSGRYI